MMIVFLTIALTLIGCSLLTASAQAALSWFNPRASLSSTDTLIFPEGQLEPEEREATDPAWLGIFGATVRPAMAEAMGLPPDQSGVLVHFVEPDSPAQQADLQECKNYVTIGEHHWLVGGDIITGFDGQPVDTMQDLHALLDQAQPGQQVTLTILRNGESINRVTTLAELPDLDLTTPTKPTLQTT